MPTTTEPRFYRVLVDSQRRSSTKVYEVIVIATSYAEAQRLAAEEVEDRYGFPAHPRAESAVDIIPDSPRIVAVEEA